MDVREQYSYLKPQPVVWVAILGSAALHAFLLGLLVLGGVLEESRTPLKDKAIITRLVRKGKKRPENWLPTKPSRPPPQAEQPKAVVPQPQTKTEPKKVPKTKRRRSRRTRDYSKEMDSAFAALGKQSDREPEGEEDGAIDGDALIAQKGDVYKTKIYLKIKSNWEVPTLIPDRERLFLNAVVLVYLDSAGGIKKIKFEKKSGNGLFDSAAARTVRRSAPFPPPPKELAKRYERDGIGIPFTAGKS